MKAKPAVGRAANRPAPKKPSVSPGTGRLAKLPVAAHPRGTQTLQRAVGILRQISTFQNGLRLVDIASAMALERPTVHRILKGLVSQGMAVQDPTTKVYRLGHVVYELGLAASPYYNLREICQPTLARLAERTGDSVFLVARSGFDTVCIERMEGSYPIRARTLDVGMRRPLGVGAASLALMLPLSDAEIDRVITINAPRMPSFGLMTGERLREAIARSRALGYAINDQDVLPGVTAVGAALMTRRGAYAAISIASVSARMAGQRREELAQMVLKDARAMARKLDEVSASWL